MYQGFFCLFVFPSQQRFATISLGIHVFILLLSDVKKVKNKAMSFSNTEFFRILKSKTSCKIMQKDPMSKLHEEKN